MVGIIYMYTSPSGKSYIGRDLYNGKRKNVHKNVSIKLNTKWGKALRKYGYESMEYIILDTIEHNDKFVLNTLLNESEMYYINFYNTYKNGYNSTKGGNGSVGFKHVYTEEQCKSRSERRKGKKHTEDTKIKIGKAHKGRKKSESQIKKMSISNLNKIPWNKGIPSNIPREKHGMYGKTHTEESRSKISISNKGRFVGSKSCRAKKVICITTNEIFDTVSEAAKKYNTTTSHISRCCMGKLKYAKTDENNKPLVWEYY